MSPSRGPEPFGEAQGRLERLIALPFAHRGLHGGSVPENSLAAFRAALALGHGIELDVQPSSDGEAMVFHDPTLERLSDGAGPISQHSSAELGRLSLGGSGEPIPTLREALELIAGRVPLLIEVKSGPELGRLCLAVRSALQDYHGHFAVMSFNPNVGHWFARQAPRVTRGLVVTEAGKRHHGRIARWLSLRRARPHFLAYDIRDLPSRFAARQRARGLPVLTWTCRGAEQRARAALHADQIIYEVAPAAHG